MAVKSTSTLKGYFETGDTPTQAQFVHLIDSLDHGYEPLGLTATTVTTSTLAVATHTVQVGAFVQVAVDAQTLTLPAVVVGATFIIVNGVDSTGALLTISPNSSDKFLVDIAGAAGTNNKDIINTKATQKKYDYVKLVGLSSDGWLIDEVRGTWVDEA